METEFVGEKISKEMLIDINEELLPSKTESTKEDDKKAYLKESLLLHLLQTVQDFPCQILSSFRPCFQSKAGRHSGQTVRRNIP